MHMQQTLLLLTHGFIFIDLEAGRNAGCRVALVRTGYGPQVDGTLADLVAPDLGAAVDRILQEGF
jgi:phosphoglycolate phosphatase-like HAD superfamily hydrolase